MELIAGDVEAFHFGVADLDALLVAAGVEDALDFQTGLGGRGTNQLDHSKAIGERSAAPVLRDVAEQAVLDLVPLRCARRIMEDASRVLSHRPAFATRPSRAAHARHWSRRSLP